MDFDAIMRITGRICPFVVLAVSLCSFNNMSVNIETILANFMYPSVDHWCSTPALQHLPQQQQRYISIPYDGSDGNYETCSAYYLDWTNYTESELAAWNWTGVDTGQLPRTHCVSGWTYDNSTFHSTATSEWDLVCDKASFQEMLSPVYMTGLFLGSMISGPLSDSQGRLKTLMIFVVVSLVSGVGIILAVNEWMFMFCRFTLAMGHRISAISGVVIMMEIITPKYRSHSVGAARVIFSSGAVVATCAGYFLRDFRVLQLSMIAPLVLMFMLCCLIPESPRWLMSKGRHQEAKAAVLKLARRVKSTIPDHLLENPISQETTPSSGNQPTSSVKDLFKTPTFLRWIFIISMSKMASQFVYFGVTMNMDRLFGDIYLNILLAAITEIPAVLVVMAAMQRLGNKRTAFILYCLTAIGGIVALSLQALAVTSMATTVTLLLVRCAASGSVSTATVLSGELFPSGMRQTAVSVTSAISSLFSIFSPFVGGPMQAIWEPLPSLVFSILSMVAAALTLLLPDTRGKAMPETTEDAINLARMCNKNQQPHQKENDETPENEDKTSDQGRYEKGLILSDMVVSNGLSFSNGMVTSPSQAGVVAGSRHYPVGVDADSSGCQNWGFQDEFDIRL